MRWKLLLIASLIATLIGAGATLAVVFGLLGNVHRLTAPDAIVWATLAVPVLAIAGAGFFVYRHTARRRKTQAMATILLSSILTLTVLLLAATFLSTPAPENPPPQPRKIA